ncbi:RNA-dependent RNA polymerase, mitoviral [Dillenia turbinata]|uniref:RNA-dependent RNA polymerase, mitoviral n=1 Tax=Dillenia turbinata TaxID=194707 RepID=A0AAN8UZA4_9MAGN
MVSPKKSCFTALMYEMAAFGDLVQFVHAYGEQWSQGALWPHFTRYAFDRENNKRISEWSLEFYEKYIGPYSYTTRDLGIIYVPSGKLCWFAAGSGKRRIFAICNYVNQRLLKPFHDWLMSILRIIPMDGTFNQVRPLEYIAGKKEYYSFDLKSATDRWPLLYQFELVQSLFDRSFASSVVNSALGCNVFDVPFVKKPTRLSFVAGQPLGYYSSWPLFALSHHLLVWYSAEQVYPYRYFTDYAILGDDVVIADRRVASAYSANLERLGVSISHGKSLISKSGAYEFAKKFRIKGGTVDLSPVSLSSLRNFFHPYGLLAIAGTYRGKECRGIFEVLAL